MCAADNGQEISRARFPAPCQRGTPNQTGAIVEERLDAAQQHRCATRQSSQQHDRKTAAEQKAMTQIDGDDPEILPTLEKVCSKSNIREHEPGMHRKELVWAFEKANCIESHPRE